MNALKKLNQKLDKTLSSPNVNDETKCSIMRAACKLFGKFGADAVTVRDICKEADVNVSAVSYHFESKDGLYHECLKSYGSMRLENVQRILKSPQNLEEFKIRLKMFAEEMILGFINNPDIYSLVSREIENQFPRFENIFEQTFLQIFKSLSSFFESAQQQKLLNPNLDSEIAAGMFFGAFNNAVKHDFLWEKYWKKTLKEEKYRELYINQLIEIFTHGVTHQEKK